MTRLRSLWPLLLAGVLALATGGHLMAGASELIRVAAHPTVRLGGPALLGLLETAALACLLLGVAVGALQPRTAVVEQPSSARMSATEKVPRVTGGEAAASTPARANRLERAEGRPEMTGGPEPSVPLHSCPGPVAAAIEMVDRLETTGPVAPGRHREPTRAKRLLPAVRLEDPEWSRALLGLIASSQVVPSAVALSLSEGAVDVHLALESPEAPGPFEPLEGRRWRLTRSDGLLAEMPDTRTVVAASRRAGLVTAARSDGGRLLLDLVACKSVALDGPPVAVGATLSDIVVELATRRWCDLDELIVVGFGAELLDLEGVHCLSGADEARAYLLAAATGTHRLFWGRCIVVAPPLSGGSTLGDSSLRSLLDLAQTLPDTGVVCCDPSAAHVRTIWRLESHRRTADISLRWPGSEPRRLPLDQTGEEGERASRTAARQAIPATVSLMPRTESSHRPSEDVLIRVLGPVEIENSEEPLAGRRRITEVLVYLALHPEGCSGEALSTAVWPDRRVPTQTVANRLSEARRMLGVAGDGRPRLTRTGGRHVLHGVETDWQRFETMTGEDAALEELLEATSLIRGRPFEGLSETGWALLEGHIASMEARISEVACRAATSALSVGRLDEAEKVVRRCLLASPWDERLYRMLMTVCHAAGNRGGVEEALRSLAHVLEWEGEPVEGVHPETARLYRRLMTE